MNGMGPDSVFLTSKCEGEVAVCLSDEHLKDISTIISELSCLWKNIRNGVKDAIEWITQP